MAKVLDIAYWGEPVLREKSKPVDLKDINNEQFTSFLEDMKQTVRAKDGVGLAAPQVFKAIRMFLIDLDAINEGKGFRVYINPIFKPVGNGAKRVVDGCVSLPLLWGFTNRYKKIKVTYWDEGGKKHEEVESNMISHIIQHEIDHLDGILWVDRVESREDIFYEDVFKKYYKK